MERISLNKEVSLSRIVYGMWRLGDDEIPVLTTCAPKSMPVWIRVLRHLIRQIFMVGMRPRKFWEMRCQDRL